MGTTAKNEYIPGVCNIGPAELARRRRAGWTGVVIFGGLLGLLLVTDAPVVYRLVLFIPAVFAAVGFLQVALHFCAAFGFMGVYNFRTKTGHTDTADQAEFRAKDRQKAAKIITYAVLLAGGVTAISLLI